VLLKCLQSWASVVFTSSTFRVSIIVSNFNNLFLWRNDGKFWYYCMHHCTWKCVSYGVRLIFYNIVRCPAGHRPMISYTPPVQYVTTQEKFLKNRPVPGRLSNSPVMCKSLKSYVVSFICDHSIICVSIFTMQTSVVVSQWLERSPCMLIVYDCFIALIFI